MNTTVERCSTDQCDQSHSSNEDDRDILSDSHRSYMIRYIEWENLRQERVSERFLRERSRPTASDSESKYQIS
jgi:hypothetical protein